MSDNQETEAPPQEVAAPEVADAGAAAEAPAAEEAAAGDAPPLPAAEAADQPDQAADAAPDAGAAAAAAAAVAARLMAEHGQQAYPVSTGVDHQQNSEGGEGANNKRLREEGADGDDLDGPDRKRMLNSGENGAGSLGADPLGFAGAPAPANPAPGGEMASDTFEVPSHLVGKLIGRAGETIRTLQMTTDTRIQVDHSGEGPNKRITVSGYTPDQVARAKSTILALDAEETTQSMDCPAAVVGRIIGRGGETIRALQSASEAHITVNQDFPADQPRQIVVQGKPQACERALLMVSELIHGEPGSAQAIIQRVCAAHGIGQTDVMTAPKMVVGRIIGRGGETIKQIQKATGATVQIDQGGDPCRITLAGQASSVQQAKNYIVDIMNGGDPFMTGGGGGMPGGYGGGMPGGYGAPQPYGGGGFPPGGGYGGYPPAGGGYPGGGFPPAYGGYGGQPAYGGYPQPGGGDPYAAAYGVGGQQQQQYGAVGTGYGGVEAGGGAIPAPAAGGGWAEYHDEQGRAYYYNAATGVTQWEKPADA